MATYLIESKKEKAIAAEIEQAIEDGKLPKPPSSGKPAHQCELCGGFTVLQPRCTDCAIATDQWQQVLQMAASEAPIVGYDDACGINTTDEWYIQMAQHVFNDWVWRGCPEEPMQQVVADILIPHYCRVVKFTAPIPEPQPEVEYDYVAEAARVCKKIANDPRGYERAKQREKAWREARAACYSLRGDVTPRKHPPTPQQLQSNSEVLEAIAMSKLSVDPERIAEMEEAVRFAIENWVNIQARVLFDGYELKQGGFTVMLKHTSHPSGVTVGLTDPTTHKLSFVARRGEIREFMHKVASGMKPSDNPKLPGVMMQAPIPDDVKMTPQLRTLKTMSEESTLWFDIMADDDDRPAA